MTPASRAGARRSQGRYRTIASSAWYNTRKRVVPARASVFRCQFDECIRFRTRARTPRHRLAEVAEVRRPRRAAALGRRHGFQVGSRHHRGASPTGGSRRLRLRAAGAVDRRRHRPRDGTAVRLEDRAGVDRLATGSRGRPQRHRPGVRRARGRGAHAGAGLPAVHVGPEAQRPRVRHHSLDTGAFRRRRPLGHRLGRARAGRDAAHAAFLPLQPAQPPRPRLAARGARAARRTCPPRCFPRRSPRAP
jgi:hypothetical protein